MSSDHAPSLAAPLSPAEEAAIGNEHHHGEFIDGCVCGEIDCEQMRLLATLAALRAESVAAPLDARTFGEAVKDAVRALPPMHVTNTEYVPQAKRRPDAVIDRAAVLLAVERLIREALAAVPPALDAASIDVDRLAAAMAEAWPGWLEEAPTTAAGREEIAEYANSIAAEYERLGAATPASGEPAAPCVRVSNPDQGIDSHWCLTHDAEWLLGAARCVARGSAPPAAGAKEPPR